VFENEGCGECLGLFRENELNFTCRELQFRILIFIDMIIRSRWSRKIGYVAQTRKYETHVKF
jgi:hypothetical protein